ncbi:MAG: NAD-dependent epimerase/dehydratase family protein [Opitutaceae bacterium]|jgi:CDP-paratose 2-epimerase
MKILITGICGFAGSAIARALLAGRPGLELTGLDNLSREGSHHNLAPLRAAGVRVLHGDLRCPSDLDALPPVDAVIDCAAEPSVLAGLDSGNGSRRLVEHNLIGTLHLLEYCKRHRAALILISTSRVYSIPPLSSLPLVVRRGGFTPDLEKPLPPGMSTAGVAETFSTEPPVSLYGATKRASETMALEYGDAFNFPVWINRCGVLSGAGQFGRADQGIFSYWIREWSARRPLRFIGFGGEGHQVRDCLHPADLAPLLLAQLDTPSAKVPRTLNIAGGTTQCMSLRQLSDWCRERLGPHEVAADPKDRPYDLPWVVLDSAAAEKTWGWRPRTPLVSILEEIATHSLAHPNWPR